MPGPSIINSPRSARNFTAINCAAIPETLLESELFGYEPGAFTGAVSRKDRPFRGDQRRDAVPRRDRRPPCAYPGQDPPGAPGKGGAPAGGRDSFKVDVRIIAATNKDLEKEMGEGKFREDLFYRLKVVSISLPPLRERREDIPELAEFFLHALSIMNSGKKSKG